MNWEAIGAIGELIGAAVVVVTLIYLAAQIKQTRKDVRRSINHSRAEIVRGLLLTRATDRFLSSNYVLAYQSLGGEVPEFVTIISERTGMTHDGAAALYWEQLAWWQYRVETFAHIDELTVDQRAEFEQGICQNYGSQPIEKLFYDTSKGSLPDGMVRYVDRLIAA